MESEQATIRVATDVGGTFTDAVIVENGRVRSAKAASTPPRFEQGIANALQASNLRLSDVRFFAHGSTVVINALTERKGAKVGLITTAGFRDVLEIARGNTPDIFNIYYRKPRPFVPRYLRLEVRERIDHRGRILEPLDEADVASTAARLAAEGVQAIAVCFLHAYANPEHELRALTAIAAFDPNLPTIASHQVSRLWREYERTNTTALSAYVLPPTQAYLNRLGGNLARAGLRCAPLIMQSNGGLTRIAAAADNPISLVESGPVAGVLGAAAYGKLVGLPNLISLDIGGTTAKCSLIEQGEVRITNDYYLEKTPVTAGYPINTPVVDIVEVGNGGGSIAWLDAAGSLRVGPQSAGADPGPVAYGRGGTKATTTDAHLFLGRIDAARFTGGEDSPDMASVGQAFSKLGSALGVSARAAALGTLRIANANMVNALKLVSVNRGRDPRDFALFAMGGGAGLHAAALAEELEMAEVIIPPHSAVFSAWAMLMVDQRLDLMRTAVRALDAQSLPWLARMFAEMARQGRQDFEQEGDLAAEIHCRHLLDMRYAGQEHTVKVAFAAVTDGPDEIKARFHAAHEREFTFRLSTDIEIVNLHLVMCKRLSETPLAPIEPADSPDPAPAQVGRRALRFETGEETVVDVYEGSRLLPGMAVVGPAAIEQAGAVTIIPAEARTTVDRFGGLRFQRERGRRGLYSV